MRTVGHGIFSRAIENVFSSVDEYEKSGDPDIADHLRVFGRCSSEPNEPPGSATDLNSTDAIFIVRQVQEIFRVKGKKLHFGFVDLEKAFDRVPREVIRWAVHKLGVEE